VGAPRQQVDEYRDLDDERVLVFWLKSSHALSQARQPSAMPASPVHVPGEGPSDDE
jgi:hypothetical protein